MMNAANLKICKRYILFKKFYETALWLNAIILITKINSDNQYSNIGIENYQNFCMISENGVRQGW